MKITIDRKEYRRAFKQPSSRYCAVVDLARDPAHLILTQHPENARHFCAMPLRCEIPLFDPEGSGSAYWQAIEFLEAAGVSPAAYEDVDPLQYAELFLPKEWEEWKEHTAEINEPLLEEILEKEIADFLGRNERVEFEWV